MPRSTMQKDVSLLLGLYVHTISFTWFSISNQMIISILIIMLCACSIDTKPEFLNRIMLSDEAKHFTHVGTSIYAIVAFGKRRTHMSPIMSKATVQKLMFGTVL